MWRRILALALILTAANVSALDNGDSAKSPVGSRSVGVGVGVGTLSLIGLQADLRLNSQTFRVSATYLPGSTPAFSSYAVRADCRQTLLGVDSWVFGVGLGLGWQHFLADSLAIPHPFQEKVILAPTLLVSWSELTVEVGPSLGYRDGPSIGLALELSYRIPVLRLQD